MRITQNKLKVEVLKQKQETKKEEKRRKMEEVKSESKNNSKKSHSETNLIEIETENENKFQIESLAQSTLQIRNKNENNFGHLFIFGLLKEIWIYHIFSYFDTKTKKRIRNVCRLFYHFINQITKWKINFRIFKEYLKFYEEEKNRGNEEWKPTIYQISDHHEDDLGMVNKIPNSVKTLRLEYGGPKIKDSELYYLPSSLENIILDNCYNITNEGIKNLPTSLKSLEIISYCENNKLTRELVKYLPKNLIEFKINKFI